MGVKAISVSPNLAAVIGKAGDKSDVDFDYLIQTAVRESSLNPEAKASSSSAVGLFQFLEQTWLEVMKSDGGRLGYGEYANAIEVESDGNLVVRNKDLREKVLKLREDPQIASDLAAAFTKNNGAYLESRFGRMPSAGELYIAHFMGARGAENLFEAGLSDPDQIAATLFPRQASANPSIFYDNGKPRTIRQLYQVLVAKHSDHPPASAGFQAQQFASDGSGSPSGTLEKPLPMSFRSLYSSKPYAAPESPLQSPNAGGSFFTQIYEK